MQRKKVLGRTALMMVSQNGHRKIVNKLLNNGANEGIDENFVYMYPFLQHILWKSSVTVFEQTVSQN